MFCVQCYELNHMSLGGEETWSFQQNELYYDYYLELKYGMGNFSLGWKWLSGKFLAVQKFLGAEYI
jgi:hypothetical protein